MNIRDLIYVESIATHKNFSRAASACNVSQPALSNQIKKLEQELGVPIFKRCVNEVDLTEFGFKVVEIAKQIIIHTDAIQELAIEYRELDATPFSIGMTPTLAPYLTKYFNDMMSDLYPNMRIVLVEDRPFELSQMVERKEIDIALIAHKSYEVLYNSAKKGIVDFTAIWQEPLYLGVRDGHPLTAKKSIFAKDVPANLLIRFDIPFGYDLEKDLPTQTTSMSEKIGFDVSAARFETVCRHIIYSDDCTIINAVAAEQFKCENWKLNFIEFKDEGNFRELGMIFLHGYSRSIILRKIATYINNAPPKGTISMLKN